MRTIGLWTAFLFGTTLLLATGAIGEMMQQQSGQMMQGSELQISAGEDIRQFSLQDQQGQNLGQIDQVLVDLHQGKIGYIVTRDEQQQQRVIPWNALQFDPQQQTLTLQLSADQLQQAPTGDAQVVMDQNQAQQINEFYGAAPAWGAQAQPQQIKGLQDLQQFSIVDLQGQQIGRVEQVLVDVQRGQIGYVVATSQQRPGQKHVIPWNALQPDLQQQRLTLQMSAERFQQAPTGDAQIVRDLNQARQIHQFYGVSPYFEMGAQQQPQQVFQPQQTSQAQTGFQPQAVKSVDTLKQFSLQDQQGQQIGQVNQLLVDVQQGKIGYVVVTSQQQTRLIPWNALRIDPQQQTMTLQISASQFQQAPTGGEQMVQDMNQARQIHQFYGVSPYWEEGMPQMNQQMQQQHQQIHQQMHPQLPSQQPSQQQFPPQRQ